MTEPIVIVAGPTASGKSALALDLARAFAGTVVNADSMQVYAELRVLTARPAPGDEAAAPHRLFGVLGANEACSAGRWLGMAAAEIGAVRAAARLPVVVGGTGLYLKALTEGLADVPEIPAGLGDEVRALHDRIGEAAFRDELARLDPGATERIPAGDAQRLKRAMAVVRATGRTLADWQAAQAEGPAVDARFVTVVLMPARDALYAAIEARFDAMMAAGALDEARRLRDLGLDPGLPAMKAVGVPELMRHLSGESTLEDAVARAKRASRNYAKRQLTWLRHQVAADVVVDGLYGDAMRDEALARVGRLIGRG